MQLIAWREQGMPLPLKLDRRRYYGREKVNQFLVILA